jgi:hypothetical protein
MKRFWLMGLASMLLLAACTAPAPDDVDSEAAPTATSFRAYSQAGGNAGVSNGLVAFNWAVSDKDGDTVACGIDFENDGNTWAAWDPQWGDFYEYDSDFSSPYSSYGEPSWEIDYDNDGDGDPVDMAFRPFTPLSGSAPAFDGSLSQYITDAISGPYFSYPYYYWDDNTEDPWAIHTHEGCTSWNMALGLMNPGTYTAKLHVTDQPNPASPNPYPSTTTRTVTYQVRNQAPVIRYFLVDQENNFGYNPLTFYWDAQDPNDPYARELYCDLDLDGNGSYEVSNLCEYFLERPFDIDDGDGDRWSIRGSEENSTWYGYGYEFAGYKKLSTFKPRLRVRDADGGVTTATITIGRMSAAQANLTPVIDQFIVNTNAFDTDYLVEEGPVTVTFTIDIDQPSFPENASGTQQDELDRLTCYLDPEGDGVFNYTIPDCWNATENVDSGSWDLKTHTYKTRGLYFPRVKVVDGKGGVVESILFRYGGDRVRGLRADDFCRARYDADLDDHDYDNNGSETIYGEDIRAFTRLPIYCQGGNVYRSSEPDSSYRDLDIGWNSLSWMFPENEGDSCEFYDDGIDAEYDTGCLRSADSQVLALSKPRLPVRNIPKGTGIGPVNFSGAIMVLNTLPEAQIVSTSPAAQSGVVYLPRAPYQFKVTHRVSDPDGDTVACAVYRDVPTLKYSQTPTWEKYTSLGVCSQNGAAVTRTSTYTFPLIDPDNLPAFWDGDNLFRAFDGLDAQFARNDWEFEVGYDSDTETEGNNDSYGEWQDFANPIVIESERQIPLPAVCQGSATNCVP